MDNFITILYWILMVLLTVATIFSGACTVTCLHGFLYSKTKAQETDNAKSMLVWIKTTLALLFIIFLTSLCYSITQ